MVQNGSYRCHTHSTLFFSLSGLFLCVLRVHLENLDHPADLDSSDLPDHPSDPDHLDNLDPPDQPDHLDHTDQSNHSDNPD